MLTREDHQAVLGPFRVDLRLLSLAAILALVVYGYEIFDFTLSIDEEVHTYSGDAAAAWIGQGRWGMALLNAVLPHVSTVPFLATALFAAGLALGAALVAPVVTRGAAEGAFLVVLLVASPVWPHLAQFNTLSYGIGVALVAIGIAAQGVMASGRWSLVVATLALTLSTSIYQTLPLAFLVVSLAAVASGTATSGASRAALASYWPRLFRIGVCFVAALIFYNVVRLVLQRLFAASGYVDVFLNWREFLVAFAPTAMRTLRAAWSILAGRHPMYLGEGLAFQLIGIVGVAGLVVDIVRRRQVGAPPRWLVASAFLCALAVTVLPVVVAAGYAPVRALVPVPFFAAIVGARALRLPGPRWPQWTVLGLVAITATWISVSLFYSDAVARKRDELTAAMLADRISQVAPPSVDAIPFVLVGYLVPAEDLALRRVEVFGASFFEHDMGNPWRVGYYLRLLGVRNLVPQPVTAVIPILREVEAMPSWPAPGSVALVLGTVVVKLGPLSYSQERALEAAARPAATGG